MVGDGSKYLHKSNFGLLISSKLHLLRIADNFITNFSQLKNYQKIVLPLLMFWHKILPKCYVNNLFECFS
jgi:hypothetical protein